MRVVSGMAEAELMKSESLLATFRTLQAMITSGYARDQRFTLLLQLYQHHARRLFLVHEAKELDPKYRLNESQQAALRAQIVAFQHVCRNVAIPQQTLIAMNPQPSMFDYNTIWLPFPLQADMIPDVVPSLTSRDMEKRNRRETRIAKRIHNRVAELDYTKQLFPPDSSDHNEVKMKTEALVEWRKLQLIAQQQELRKAILDIHQKSPASSTNLLPPTIPILTRKLAGPGVYTSQQIDTQVKKNFEQTRKSNFRKFLTALNHHFVAFHELARSQSSQRRRLNQAITMYFKNKEKAELAAQERAQKERMRLLRENDVDAYMKLVKATKNDRLLQLLRQTDECLQKLGAKVQMQRGNQADDDAETDQKSRMNAGNWDGENTEKELDEMVKNKSQYYVLAHTIQETITEQPPSLTGGKLMSFQLAGLQWLVSLYNNNLNGILADEMGLGKTVQTISLITHLMDFKGVKGPHLILLPLSTMSNWKNEFARWAPSIKTVTYVGNQVERQNIYQKEMADGKFNVLITSFQFALQDKNRLKKFAWKYLIVDEGHRLKNHNSKLSIALSREFNTKNRLILTGTPLQNDMGELWALLNFLLPNIFNSSISFEEWFNAPFQRVAGQPVQMDEEEMFLVINRLHQVLRPFLLRRMKSEVENDLPDKFEEVLKCELSGWQQIMYEQIQSKNMKVIDEDTGQVRVANLMNTLMQLRKVCNHPYLFYEAEDFVNEEIYRCSGKFELLDRLLQKLKAGGHRVLIFNQMKQVMDIMCRYLEWRGYTHLRLDGGTKAYERSKMLAEFNAKDSPYFAFVLSTRAGGLGLNLQTADTVIIFDSDWNPQMDLQAQARAHRIGQKKMVHIYRLVTATPIEQEIVDRATFKLAIDAKVIQAGMFNDNAREHERQQMLRSILKVTEDSVQKVKIPTLTEINKKISRSEEEFHLFEKIDAEIEETHRRACIRGGCDPSNVPPRLMGKDDVPDWVLRTEVDDTEEKQVQPIERGRGCRNRQSIRYNDNLTDRDWDDLFENGADTEEIEKKRLEKEERLQQRREKAARKRGRKSSNSGTEAPEEQNTEPDEDEKSSDGNASDSDENSKTRAKRRKEEKNTSASIDQETPINTQETQDEAPQQRRRSTKVVIRRKPTEEPQGTSEAVVSPNQDTPPITSPKIRLKRAVKQEAPKGLDANDKAFMSKIVQDLEKTRHPRDGRLIRSVQTSYRVISVNLILPI
eukprot:TRINITY_DN4781_c0_g1_i4.p1 TRINITY_DN4781_c0_g1~~TRINITY_DN4781_c0_g1_i4.p1  ORF type:complete len:1214 (-),score=254.60 TRINITY_DN4781_c0_g1_i4:717-4358(-)